MDELLPRLQSAAPQDLGVETPATGASSNARTAAGWLSCAIQTDVVRYLYGATRAEAKQRLLEAQAVAQIRSAAA